jgi:ligand-binding SRPBCC domain-containing protein
MVEINLGTFFAAPQERVFDLIRDVSIHPQTTGKTRERVVESSRQMLELGDTVTFEAVHFGIRQRLSSEVVEYERPTLFADRMTKGAFKSLLHERRLLPQPDGTLMQETLRFEAPFGPLGKLAERLFLARYMKRFLRKRNQELKAILENGAP